MSEVTNDLRIEVRKALETVWELESEDAVRIHVDSLNSLIVRGQMGLGARRENQIPLLQVEEIVREWREKS
ncbi:MAG: hypothetical protein U9Q79_04070 [Candidatus Hydrogenedentes bacterium]|nr:hypothetical protein [Candidatus Hydrogenedentota bacterium]